MLEMKYIIVDNIYPIIFPTHMNHIDIASNYNVTSAGFIDRVGKIYGYSDSFNLNSKPNDQKIKDIILGKEK